MLITGIAGVPGYNAFHYFRKRYGDQVIGTRQSSMWPLAGEGIVPCDVEDQRGVAELWAKHRFKAVINCAGSCRLKSCELDPHMAHRVNVLGTEHMIECSIKHEARVIHLSIDLVFSGRDHGCYTESDRPDPVTVYGAKMVQAEQVIAAQRPDACILRISLPMGISFNGHAGAVDWIASRFKQSKPATLYFDEVRTPTYTDCLNQLFEKLLVHPVSGIYHAGGPRKLSLFEIAQVVNYVGGYEPKLLQGCPRIQAGPMPPRAGNVTLDSSKLTEILGHQPFDPWPVDPGLVPTNRDWHYERNEAFAGSAELIAELLYCNRNLDEVTVPPSRNQLWKNGRFHFH
jgi:dTDP-4-dehydrorhamnose reductase